MALPQQLGQGDRGKQELLQELGVLERQDVIEHKSHAPQSREHSGTCVLHDTCLLAPGSALPERLQLGSDLHPGPGRILAGKIVAGQEKEPCLQPTSAWSRDEANEWLLRFHGQQQGGTCRKPQPETGMGKG